MCPISGVQIHHVHKLKPNPNSEKNCSYPNPNQMQKLCPTCQYYWQKSSNDVMTSRRDITWHHAVTPHDIIWYNKVNLAQVTLSENPKIMFFILATWPLTYDLDLQTYPRYCQGESFHQILSPYLQWFSQKSANRHTDTQTRTDGTNSIPLIADARGNDLVKVFEKCIKWPGNHLCQDILGV